MSPRDTGHLHNSIVESNQPPTASTSGTTDESRVRLAADGSSPPETGSESKPVSGVQSTTENGVLSRVTPEIDVRELLAEQIIGETPFVPPREPLGARLAAIMGRRHWLLLPLCVLLLWATLTLRPPGEALDYTQGEAAPRDIIAPHSATLLDRELTERNRDAAADLVPPQYDVRP
ncbi:MAG TPA: hypothetical protein VF719_00735, partial [Abditibacteriaceae bacterium]